MNPSAPNRPHYFKRAWTGSDGIRLTVYEDRESCQWYWKVYEHSKIICDCGKGYLSRSSITNALVKLISLTTGSPIGSVACDAVVDLRAE